MNNDFILDTIEINEISQEKKEYYAIIITICKCKEKV